MFSKFKRLAAGVFARIGSHHLSLVAAGVAFYGFLSIFPAIATIISLYGLVTDAQTVQSHINSITGFVPHDVKELLFRRMKDVASEQASSLNLGLVIGIVLSLWSANRAMKAITQGLNITYEKKETRGFIKRNFVTLALTLVTSLVTIVVILIAVFLPIVVSYFLSQDTTKVLTTIVSWLLLVAMLMGLMLCLYRYAPAREERPKMKESLLGAVFSTILIVLSSIAFSFYVSNFGKYDEEYGAISAVIVTLLWMFLGSFIFLLGAEFNGESGKIENEK